MCARQEAGLKSHPYAINTFTGLQLDGHGRNALDVGNDEIGVEVARRPSQERRGKGGGCIQSNDCAAVEWAAKKDLVLAVLKSDNIYECGAERDGCTLNLFLERRGELPRECDSREEVGRLCAVASREAPQADSSVSSCSVFLFLILFLTLLEGRAARQRTDKSDKHGHNGL